MACTDCLSDKVTHAIDLIREMGSWFANPIVFSSFGKDSMVLLDLVKRANLKFPILFFREAFSPRKYLFANAMIHAEEYTVYDYPPLRTLFSKRGEVAEIVNLHQAPGEGMPIYVPTGIKPPKMGEPFLCGLQDLYGKPLAGNYTFPWDLALIGHKSSDVDPILGPIPLNTFFQEGSPSSIFPLRDFTDQDIWKYTQEVGLPINEQRYNRLDGWKEFDDVTFNPDYFRACTACMDPASPPEVFCPKFEKPVKNVSGEIRWLAALEAPPYMEKNKKKR